MKKILLLIAGISFGINTMAQDAEGKEVQAGLVFGSSILMQNVTSDYFQKGGLSYDLSIGMNVNFSLTESLAFCTGVEFDFETLKYQANPNYDLFYVYEGKNIIPQSDVDLLGGQQSIFQMTDRIQKATYLTIPTMLQFRTNFIGYFRYFGKFGLRNSFLVKSVINDKFEDLNTSTNRDDMRAKNDLFFLKSAVGMSLGAEWNFVGSTCLVAELGYYYGFTPLHTQWNTDKQKNYYYAEPISNPLNGYAQINNSAQQSQLQFKLSILF
ncbi:MAG: hypothetical protein RL632_413 [Bacteroidota bacterium]|jgi:hypothetical protein